VSATPSIERDGREKVFGPILHASAVARAAHGC
jgi:hypothetical protein